jgi:hypothetical protein
MKCDDDDHVWEPRQVRYDYRCERCGETCDPETVEGERKRREYEEFAARQFLKAWVPWAMQ